jgi:hypothetical protein
LILAQAQDGGRWTQITTDASGVSSAQSIWNMGLVCGYQPPEDSVVAIRPGWPVECVLGLAGLGEPRRSVGWRFMRPGGGRGWEMRAGR